MTRAVRTAGQNHFTGIQDTESLFVVLAFSLTGLLGCLVSQASLDGPAFTLVRPLLILASAPIAALTGLVFGGGE